MNLDNNTFICDLAGYGILKVSGLDAKKLLQGQFTCDLEKIHTNQGTMGALCNPQGRIISLFVLGLLDDAYYLIMPINMVAITQTTLKKFAVFYKVNLTDMSQEWGVLGLQTQLNLPEDFFSVSLPTTTRRIVASEREKIAAFKTQLPADITMLNEAAWHKMNIEAKLPQIYPETSGKILPHEINLTSLNAIDFEKGCYTGQEIIARMHYRGKLKVQLRIARVIATQDAKPAMSIFREDTNELIACGTIIDTCADNHESLALIIIDNESANNPSLHLEQDLQSSLRII